MYSSKISRYIYFVLLLFFLTIGISGMSAKAATYGTVSVSSGCSYPCNGYYTSHFNAQIDATSYSTTQLQTSQFRGTMTHGNQNGDQWGIMLLDVYSSGSLVYQAIPGNLYKAANSSYWQRLNASKLITKGNNRIDFNFAYVLKHPNGAVAERWYPIRRASNIK